MDIYKSVVIIIRKLFTRICQLLQTSFDFLAHYKLLFGILLNKMKALQLVKPHVLVVIGAPASGKTEFAEKFSDTFHAPYINAKMFQFEGYSPATALGLALEVMSQIQKTKQTVVYEGISGTRVERAQIMKQAKANGYEPLFIWVQTDPAIARARATRRTRSNPNPMTVEEFEHDLKRFTPPSQQEPTVVISGMHTYATQAKAVLKRLAEMTGRAAAPSANAAQGRRSVTAR